MKLNLKLDARVYALLVPLADFLMKNDLFSPALLVPRSLIVDTQKLGVETSSREVRPVRLLPSLIDPSQAISHKLADRATYTSQYSSQECE